MLQYVAVCCGMLQCAAVRCSVLQCVAVCCSVLQCVAVCCSVLQGAIEMIECVLFLGMHLQALRHLTHVHAVRHA